MLTQKEKIEAQIALRISRLNVGDIVNCLVDKQPITGNITMIKGRMGKIQTNLGFFMVDLASAIKLGHIGEERTYEKVKKVKPEPKRNRMELPDPSELIW